MDNSITIFVACAITFVVAYCGGYIYGVKRGVEHTTVFATLNLKQAARILGLEKELTDIFNTASRLLKDDK